MFEKSGRRDSNRPLKLGHPPWQGEGRAFEVAKPVATCASRVDAADGPSGLAAARMEFLSGLLNGTVDAVDLGILLAAWN
jgi:hypothetical protein